MKNTIISGTTQRFYHTIPSDLDTISLSPTKDAIFKYLSRIDYNKFPEFILDILTQIDGHKRVDVTDGPGDEKQDILTFTPNGMRCLTQCKHSERYNNHYAGDGADLMVSACLRKDCMAGKFVTNTDLTPQAKNYFNDKEYLRGLQGKIPLVIDYWNGDAIWDKIKNNGAILNKWFGGLGQTHGLRTFKFDVTVQQMPYDNDHDAESPFEKVITILLEKKLIRKVNGYNEVYNGRIREGLSIEIKKWFHFSGDLDIKFMPPGSNANFLYHPLFALAIEVFIGDSTQTYSPEIIKKEVIKYLFDTTLANLENCTWWHITASQSTSFVFLHDIIEPRQVKLDSAITFVSVTPETLRPEVDYCSLDKVLFYSKYDDDDDQAIWIHNESKTEVVLFFEEKLNPVYSYNYQLEQEYRLKEVADFTFRAISGIGEVNLMRVRRMLDHEWLAFIHNDDTLIWCFPPESSLKKIERIEKKLAAVGLKVLQLDDETRAHVLAEIKVDRAPTTLTHSEIGNLTFPVNLDKRGFWLSFNIELPRKLTIEQEIKLLEYKFQYEHKQGFDHMQGQQTLKSHSSELPNMLFDIFSIRAIRMIDMAILDNPISIHYRVFENSLERTNELALKYITEFQEIINQINSLIGL